MTIAAAPATAGLASLDALVRPRSVAIIGASDEPARIGGRPIAYMQERGFQGEIWPVNPKRATVQGLAAYASVEALPAAPDVAIIAVPAEHAIATLDSLGHKGCRAVIVFSAGFGFFPSLFGLQFNTVYIAPQRRGGQLSAEDAHQLLLSRLLLSVGSIILMILLLL